MNLSIISIGNFKGIRLPKEVIEKYGITDSVELILETDHIKLKPKTRARQGWEDSFALMHHSGDDKLLNVDVFEDDKFD